MSYKLLLVCVAGFAATAAGCQSCYDPYDYSGPAYNSAPVYGAPVYGAPVSGGCSSCATTPSVTTYAQPSPTLAPGQ